jgi:cellulose synthase (UDP-forming)
MSATMRPPVLEGVEGRRREPVFYFSRFEHRTPPPPVPHSALRESAWQVLAVANLALGAWYMTWRWTASLNYDALWFALPLVIAETFAFFGLILFTINLWQTRDRPLAPPPRFISECVGDGETPARPISVDAFFPTYDEDPELVRLSLRDAKRITYPYAIDLRIHVLDDGRRPAMRRVADEESVGYITRDSNVGFKAGNMRNAMERTSGDFILICDADTRPFPTILEHTLGYFRNPDMAWVQTPQWFFDLSEGRPLPAALARRLGRIGRGLGRLVERLVGPVRLGADPFCSDPQMFFDVIQRRRNWANAAFCCGAGSVHRRDAVLQVALKAWAEDVDRSVFEVTRGATDPMSGQLAGFMRKEVAVDTDVIPFRYHVSEDIYTSITLHEDRTRRWQSVLHPWIQSKMLSPQDLQSWSVQRFKYAGGTLDIALHDNPLFRRGLSLPQRLMYGMSFWSYFGCLWNVVFLAAPIVYLFTGIPPVSAYSTEFFKHMLPFFFVNELAFMVGTWGVATWSAKAFYLAFFPLNLRALWVVLKGERIKFPTTPKNRQEGTFLHLVIPQIAVIALTVAGVLFVGVKAWLGYAVDPRGILANTFWAGTNVLAMSKLVRAAVWKPEDQT